MSRGLVERDSLCDPRASRSFRLISAVQNVQPDRERLSAAAGCDYVTMGIVDTTPLSPAGRLSPTHPVASTRPFV